MQAAGPQPARIAFRPHLPVFPGTLPTGALKMNWKSASLKILLVQVAALGAIAGIWGSVLEEGFQILQSWLAGPEWPIMISGGAMGLALGAFLAPIEGLVLRLNGRVWRSALGGALAGLVVGTLGGAAVQALGREAGWAAQVGLEPAVAAPWMVFPAVMGALGGAIGWCSYLGSGAGRPRRRRLWRGFGMGLVMALPLSALQTRWNHPWVMLASLAVWGAAVALALFWWERRTARRWLRLLTPPGEEAIYPLAGARLSVGKSQHNDIALRGFNEVYPRHCELWLVEQQYRIGNPEEDGVVLVNYREAQDHTLKSGDIVKIGSALLQYGEAS